MGEDYIRGKQKAMYCTRDAVQNFQRRCSDTVRELGVATGKAPLCHFLHIGWHMCCLVQRDDSVFMGKSEFLLATASHVDEKLKVKVSTTGPRAPGRLACVEQEHSVGE